MKIDDSLLEKLLYESASDTLIFRPVEYKFTGALNLEKSQILRDVLGVTNSWRRNDTCILIGVEEAKAGRNKVRGVIEHLDEKTVVEFVNSKVQKPIDFFYRPLVCDRKKIGLIYIPLQERPFFLKEDFANLKKYVIYVRRGDFILEADREEVAKIKEFSLKEKKPAPALRLEFAQGIKKKPLGNHLIMKTFLIEVPERDQLPDLEIAPRNPQEEFFYFPFCMKVNRSYYRELAEHFQKVGRVSLIDFCISNTGSALAGNVQMDIDIDDPEEKFFIQEIGELPPRPEKDAGQSNQKSILLFPNPQVWIRKIASLWTIRIQFGDIPPLGTVFSSNAFYLGAKASMVMDMHGAITCRNFTQPLHFPLTIDIQVQREKLDKGFICK